MVWEVWPRLQAGLVADGPLAHEETANELCPREKEKFRVLYRLEIFLAFAFMELAIF
jgi:hypothetical protein